MSESATDVTHVHRDVGVAPRQAGRTSRIRVLFVQSQSYFGADFRVHSVWMRYLDRERFDVYAACDRGDGAKPSASLHSLREIPDLHLRPTYFGPSINEVPLHVILLRFLIFSVPTALSLLRLASFLRAQRIDIVHCTEKPRDAFYGLLLARAARARCVIHVHVKAMNWMSPLTRWAMRRADALIGVSEFVSQSLRAMGYAPEKIYTVHNALDCERWRPELSGAAIRLEFGIASTTPLLLIASRVFSWKGHADLLRALALVKRQVSDAMLLVVGEDDPRATIGHGSHSAELKALAEELGIRRDVVFTGFRADIAELMAACDIFAMPSFEEPFGMVYLEAMAMKKPIVALDNGGTPEVVARDRSGLLSPPGHVEALVANILSLLRDPGRRLAMGVIGRQRVETVFSPAAIMKRAEEVYARILSPPV